MVVLFWLRLRAEDAASSITVQRLFSTARVLQAWCCLFPVEMLSRNYVLPRGIRLPWYYTDLGHVRQTS